MSKCVFDSGAAGLLMFRSAPVDARYALDLLPVMVLLGLGAGLVFPGVTTLAMSAATPTGSPDGLLPVTNRKLPMLIAARKTPVGASSLTTWLATWLTNRPSICRPRRGAREWPASPASGTKH